MNTDKDELFFANVYIEVTRCAGREGSLGGAFPISSVS